MYWFLSLLVALVLSFIIVLLPSPLAGMLGFTVIAATLFRICFYMLDIRSRIGPETDRVEQAYQNYLEEKRSENH
ncbi:hypothetical protein [Pseudalkalibacillus caeni]|uniref:DUF4229 domain-containing protein n=1 Tax=Exobacillus caeni TaxID=2574798 RepID=A0A5R9F4B4_9BACL|nr:hypothetical protein [Pseudalkalibacillus caeni]TLS37240.1 hypothetical protein FCL54_12000 [Pseudalkalibacillus caeni]